ncbi:HAMP domain-containing sensor histidine kinase [Archangium sp.]|jgi:signal transduction histidine kinase|uniref:sensor histidine kinase n=1 Tax=Archangium sp. TaxID=1872627 RepID=UPI002ED858CE
MAEGPPVPPLFTQLCRLLSEPLLLVSVEGVVMGSSAAARSLLGSQEAGLHGRRLVELGVEFPERVAGYLRLCARSLEPLPGSLTLRLASGEQVRRNCRGARLEPGGTGQPPLVLLRLVADTEQGNVFGLLSRKVDELTREVTRRRQVEEELRRIMELQEQFIGIVSHDVRSPLSAILMSARQLRHLELEERNRRVVDRIERGGQRIEQVVRLLVDFTWARMGKGIPVRPKPLDVHALCAQVVDELKATRPQRVVELRGTPAWGMVDPERLFQVLANLVENAFKYGAADQPVTLSTSEVDDELRVEVHNQGEPIAPELLPKLFEPFSRGAQTEETVKLSLGLGLYIVREIVHAHGGKVEVSSTREAGTTFTLRLPRQQVGDQAGQLPARAASVR